MKTDHEIRSLLALLDDPDIVVSAAVEERLRSRGEGVVIPLLVFAATSGDELARSRANSIARELNEDALADEFQLLRTKIEEHRRGALEDGVFLIARYGYPMLDAEHYRSELDALAGMLHDRIKGIHSPLDILTATNEFFFNTRGFAGNQTNFLEADNTYINQVIDRKLGIPISLSVLYLLVAAHRLGLPFAGVSTPGHFLLRYDGIPSEPIFVDAYNGGVMLREADIRRFLTKAGLPFYDSFLRPASVRTILMRMLRNLVVLFEESEDSAAKAAFERFHSILLGKPMAVSTEEFDDELE